MLKEAAEKEKNIPGVSLCHAGWFLRELMVSEGGGAEARSPLQDEQMAESKCRDLFYISIPCCGALDVGFRFSLFFSPSSFLSSSSNVILQDNGCAQCLS